MGGIAREIKRIENLHFDNYGLLVSLKEKKRNKGMVNMEYKKAMQR